MPNFQPVESYLKLEKLKTKAIKTNTATKTLLVGAGVFLAYSLFRKSSAAGTLNFFPDKVRSFRFDGLTPVLVIGLGVQNTSNQSFTLNSIAGNLYSVKWNNTYVGNVSSFQPQAIPPNSQRIVQIEARLSLVGVANDLIQAIQNGDFSQKLLFKANANVDNLQIPITQTLNIG